MGSIIDLLVMWSTLICLTTVIAGTLCLGAGIFGFITGPEIAVIFIGSVVLVPLILMVAGFVLDSVA